MAALPAGMAFGSLFFVFISLLTCSPQVSASRVRPSPYTAGICAMIGTMELPYLSEWLSFHRQVGFQFFLLYLDMDWTSEVIVRHFIGKEVVRRYDITFFHL